MVFLYREINKRVFTTCGGVWIEIFYCLILYVKKIPQNVAEIFSLYYLDSI